MLVDAYRDYILEGNPFEIVDGDNVEMQEEFLAQVFQLFPDKKFFVISVIGPQNSGDEVYNAEDNWLEKYVLEPEKLIEGRRTERWTKFRMGLDDELIGDQVPERITIRNIVTYSVKSHWKTMVAEFPDLDMEIKKMFRSMQNVFDAVPVCTEKCPCCKRICDADHHLDINAPIGRGSNRHCCKLGHQIRGMGGIRFESTDEASLLSCEIVKDTDIIVITENERKIWKIFKEEHLNWDFGDARIRDTLKTPYSHIWNRIGEQLCK
ncbi:unnamed protein product, partial [Rotaria sp. Silwood1]